LTIPVILLEAEVKPQCHSGGIIVEGRTELAPLRTLDVRRLQPEETGEREGVRRESNPLVLRKKESDGHEQALAGLLVLSYASA
jgi:hypothetical protein